MDQLLTDGGANSKPLYCRHCGSQFLSAEKAQAVEHPISKEHFQRLADAASKTAATNTAANGKQSDDDDDAAPVSSSFWKINDMWDFDNYGQTRSVANALSSDELSSAVTPETVYVICADCERGPVGVQWKAGDPYYVSHSLVSYEARAGAPINGSLPAGMSEDFVRSMIAQKEEMAQQQQRQQQQVEEGEQQQEGSS